MSLTDKTWSATVVENMGKLQFSPLLITYYCDLQEICNESIEKLIFRDLLTTPKFLREDFQQLSSIPSFIVKNISKVRCNLVIIQNVLERNLDLKVKWNVYVGGLFIYVSAIHINSIA